ncbi:MAG TPA: hypothetical protein VEU97_16890 [Ktedonobacteraceae bacterium]|nr:hypothetical protein [Ktedonobacteraceae bacterium]
MSKLLQKMLLVLGIVALLALLIEIGLSVAATTHGSTPVRVVHVNAGAYPLTVSLYKDPADAGFAFPFAIAPQQPAKGGLNIDVSSVPTKGVDATPVHSSLSADPHVAGGIQGVAEITVQGLWQLHITVDGPAGRGEVDVPVTVTAPPAIPQWLGWSIGFIPLCGLLIFVLMQRERNSLAAIV